MQLKIKQEIKEERDIIKVITGTQIVDAAVHHGYYLNLTNERINLSELQS